MDYEEGGGRHTKGDYDFAGYQVYDMHYEKISKVDDVFVGEGDEPKYIGVKVGLLANKTTLIPLGIVRVNDKRQLLEIAADKDTIIEGPTFGDDQEITPEYERRVFGHYGLEGVQGSEQRGVHGAYYSDATGDERVDLRPGERTEAHEGRSIKQRSASAARGDVDREWDSGPADEDELRVQRAEEELKADTREREAGSMNIHKRVSTNRERLTVPKKREEVRTERVPVEGEREEAEIGEDEIRIPVIEEEVVVEKRPVIKEEIRIRKKVVEDEEVVEEDVRKEEVDIDDQTERGQGLDSGTARSMDRDDTERHGAATGSRDTDVNDERRRRGR